MRQENIWGKINMISSSTLIEATKCETTTAIKNIV